MTLRSSARPLVRRLAVVLPTAIAVAASAAVPAFAADPVLPRPAKPAPGKPGLGELSHSSFETTRLNDRTNLRVNVVNGNVIVHAQDAEIRGTGLSLSLERRYQSRSSNLTDLGYGWTASYGRDVTATPQADGAVVVNGPQGYSVRFAKNTTGFDDVAGLKVSLSANTGGGYTLTYKESKEKIVFGHRTGGTWLQTSDTDRNDNRISYAYDAQSRLASVTDTQGRVTRFAYLTDTGDFAGLISAMTDPAGRVHRYVYASTGDLVAYVDPQSTTPTGYTYTSEHDLNAVLTPEGRLTRIAYDADHRATTTSTISHEPTYRNEVLPLVNETCMPSSVVSPTVADLLATGDACAAALRESVTLIANAAPSAAYARYTYGPGTTVLTNQNNNPTTFDHDSDGRVTAVTDALGHKKSKTYTPGGDVASYTNALNSVTTLSYDTQGRLAAVQAPGTSGGQSGTKTTFGYDAGPSAYDHQPTSSTDAQGHTTSYGYDGKGNLASTTTPVATQNQFSRTYNANGTVDTATDGRGAVTRYGYDTRGNLTGVTYPAPLGATKLAYDGLSRLVSFTDGKNQTTRYAYDLLDRMVKITYADGTANTYAYDADGNLVKRTDATGVTEFTYDPRNLVLVQKDPDNAVSSYTYDAVGNLRGMQTPEGGTTYNYDAANNLSYIEPGGGAFDMIMFGHDGAGRRLTTRYGSMASQQTEYDSSGRPTVLAGSDALGNTVTRFNYSYKNALGVDTSLRQSVTDLAGNKTSYTYDPLNRLTGAKVTTSAGAVTSDQKLAYDGNGNRTSHTTGASTTSFSYNTANQLTSGGGTTYSYDANGSLTGTSSGYSYGYDARGHTTNVTTPSGVSTPMKYADATQKLRTQAGRTTFRHSILGVSGSTDTVTGSKTYYVRDNRGQLLGMIRDAQHYYFLWDAVGSIVAVLDGDGKVVNKYAYDAFGKATTVDERVANPWRFAGGYADGTGLVKLGERYYDQAGRWTQQDSKPGTLAEPNRVNGYTYASNDPVNRVDPDGRDDECTNGIFGAGLIGGLVGTFDAALLGTEALLGMKAIFGISAFGLGAAVTLVGGVAVMAVVMSQC